jgi:hypothetical protein
MRVRPYGPVLLVLVAVAATLVGVTPAAAKVPKVPGSIRCTIADPSFTFNPGLRYRNHLEGVQKGRGPSTATFAAALSGCTDPANGPAPAGIDHATVLGLGKVSGSYCEKLDRLKLKTTVTWSKADNTLVGSTVVKLAITIAKPSFDDPWTFTFTGTAKGGSRVFPRAAVSFALATTRPNWGISGSCFKLSLDDLAFLNGTFAADAPA